MKNNLILLVILVIALLSVVSCGSKVSQEEYDRVSNELSMIQGQLESLQGKLAEAGLLKTENEELSQQCDTAKGEYDDLQAEFEELSSEYEELNKQYGIVKGEYNGLQVEIEELVVAYEELSSKYDAIIAQTAVDITEDDLEQAIFAFINEDRKNNGIDELSWGINLYKVARDNSVSMAENQRLEYHSHGGNQEVYRATGYMQTDIMAEAVFKLWKNTENYALKFLNGNMNYGAVAVYKSGGIYNITFINDYFR